MFENEEFEIVEKMNRHESEFSSYDNALVVIRTKSNDLRLSSAAYRRLGSPQYVKVGNGKTQFALVPSFADEPNAYKVSRTGGKSNAHRINPQAWIKNALVLGGVYVGEWSEKKRMLIFSKSPQTIIKMTESKAK